MSGIFLLIIVSVAIFLLCGLLISIVLKTDRFEKEIDRLNRELFIFGKPKFVFCEDCGVAGSALYFQEVERKEFMASSKSWNIYYCKNHTKDYDLFVGNNFI